MRGKSGTVCAEFPVEYDEKGYAVGRNLLVTGSPDLLGGGPVSAAKIVKNIPKLTRFSPADVGKFLDEGENWHKTSAKIKYLQQFGKLLRGNKNVDFYFDPKTNEVYLLLNKSEIWIKTGHTY